MPVSRLTDCVCKVDVHRWDEAMSEWRNWISDDPLVHPYKWLRA